MMSDATGLAEAAPTAANPPAANPPAANTTAGRTQDAAPQSPGASDIFAAAGTGDATAPAGTKGARPDWCPEQFWDAEKAAPLTESLAKSWTDFRGKVSRGEGRVPETPDAYVMPVVEGLAADLVKSDDPLWTDIRTAAHKAGVTQPQLDALLKPYLGALAKLPEAVAAEDMSRVYAAEIAKLGPNGREVVRDIGGWMAGLTARGVLTAAEERSLKSVADADGLRALGKLRELSGERAIPTEALDAASMSEADARRALREGYEKNDLAMQQKGRAALEVLDRQGKLNSR